MADIKQINLAGTTYNLVDDTAVHSVSVTSALTTGITTGTVTVDGTTTTFYDASSIVALPVSYSDWTWNTSNSDEANIAGLLQTAYNLYGSNNYYKTARELHIFNGASGDYTIQLIVRFPNSWTFSKLSIASAAWPDGAFGVPNLSGQVYILSSYSNDADDRYLLFSTSETGTGEVGYKIIDLTNPGSSTTATSALTTGITIGTITVDGTTTTFYDASSIVSLPVTYNQWHWNTSDSDETNIIGLITAAYNLYGSNDYYKNASEVHIFNGSDLTNGAYICVRFPRGWHFSDWDSRDVYGNYGDPNLSGEVFFNGANGRADERHLIFTTYEGPVTDPDIIKYVITDLTNPEYVQQNAVITTATTLPVMLGYSGVTTAVTNTLNKTDSLKYNPSTKLLQTGALGVISGVGYTTVLPTTTAGSEEGQIMFVVFEET